MASPGLERLVARPSPRRLLGAAVLLAAASGLCAVSRARARTDVPTEEAREGDWVDHVELRGEVRALRSITLNAPAGAGDLLLVKLAANGSQVKPGDLIAQFDRTRLGQNLAERRATLQQAEAEIERTAAQGRLQEEQARTELTKARYDVERARLEASKQEILSAIEGEKNKLKLADAEQKLREVEAKGQATRVGAEAEAQGRRQKRSQELFAVREAERGIDSLVLRAPVAGMVTILPNQRARSSWGAGAPPFREGDRAWSGAGIAELPDITTVRIGARVDESDRGRLKLEQPATVRLDALPDREFVARVGEISPLAKPEFTSWPPTKSFDLLLAVEGADERVRPGMSASARIVVEVLPGRILAPAKVVFEKDGRSVVYARTAFGFDERQVEVSHRSASQVALARGVRAGDALALRDPTAPAEGGAR